MFRSKVRSSTSKLVYGVALSLCLGLLLPACIASAQTLYGSLTGNVTDASNASVQNATVLVKSLDTGLARSATTDSSGNYQITDLPPGTYDILVSAPSFGQNSTRAVPIGANQTKRIDAVLVPGDVSQTVEVTTAPPALQTDRADVNYEISSKQVAQLPTTSTAGRNFQGLYKLIPGIPPPQEMNSQAGNPGRTQAVNANGVANTVNSTKIDGAAVGYPWLQSIVAYIPPTDSIESANIVTNSFNAEQGSAGGVAANLIVKSGTNKFHGGGWEYNSISNFNSRSYFLRPTTALPNPPKNIYNEFGGNIGGPIIKDKLFFFFDYNRVSTRRYVNGPNTFTVPLAALRGGDFSSVIAGANGLTAAQTAIYDPITGNADGTGRTIFPGNKIPMSRLSPAALKLLSFVPAENVAGAISTNFTGGAVVAFDRGAYDTKINFNPSEKTTIFGRYSLQRSLINDPTALGVAIGNTYDGGQPGLAPGTIQNIGLGATHSFTPHFLIDANAGFVRINLAARASDYGQNVGTDVLGIPGTNGSTAFQSGTPGFILNNGLSQLGNFTQSNPFQFRDMQYVGNLNGTYIKGNHIFRFGGEYTHSAINQLQTNNAGPRGQFTFSGAVTGLNGNSSGSANYFRSVADFLLGLPQAIGKTVQLFQPNGPRFSAFGFFAQDTWKASSSLTVNYGIRYEFYPFANRDHTGVFRFDPATSNVLIGGVGSTPTDTGENVGHGQIVPRLGVNYRFNDNTVIRSGFGITVDPENYRFFRDSYPALITLNNTGINNYIPAGALSTINSTGGPYAALTVGIPTVAVPSLASGVVPLPYNYTTQTAPQNWRRGYIETWNLFIDRNLGKDVIATIGYVGTHHVRQVGGIDLNAGGVSPLGAASRPLFANSSAPGGALRYTGTILSVTPFGDVEYSGLQAQVTDRQFKSFQFGYAYTWSHTLNDYDTNSTLGSLLFNTPALFKRNYGNSNFDRTHINALWTVWQIPVGPGRQYMNNSLIGKLVGGFDLSTITSYDSGTPFQITDSSQNGNGDTAVPNQVSKLVFSGTQYNNALSTTQPYYFQNNGNIVKLASAAANGNIGRNTYRGPGFFDLDASISRTIPIFREYGIILRAEAFDVTNTVQWSNPQGNANDGGFGRIQSVLSSSNRNIRLSGRFSF